MLPEEIEDQDIIEEWLTARRERRVHLRIPKKGTKEKLVELAQKNAQMVLKNDRERLKREEGRTIGAVKELEKILGLKGIIRMEAYDISNTNGFDSVGSMVVLNMGNQNGTITANSKLKLCRVRMIMPV